MLRTFLLSLLLCLLLSGGVASAQPLIPDASLGPCNFYTGDIHFDCVPYYIGYLIKILMGFAGGFFLFGIMIAGYKYMFGSITSQGTEAGKKEIIALCIGLAVIVLSYLLVDTIIEALT